MPSPTTTLVLTVAMDDPDKDAIAFESGETQQVFDKNAGQLIDRPKWNWIARAHIHSMEPVDGDTVRVAITEWVAKKKGLI